MNEIDKLRKMLADADIPFVSYKYERKEIGTDRYEELIAELFGDAVTWERNQVVYGFTGVSYKVSAIYQKGSYGAKDGLIETWGSLGGDKNGEPDIKTAEETFKIISDDWHSLSNRTQARYRRTANEINSLPQL